MKNIVVNGFTISISNSQIVATIVPSGTPSVKCKATGLGICKDQFSVVVTNITLPTAGATIPDPGPYTFNFSASSTKCKAESTLVLLEGDTTQDLTATPQIPGSPPTPYPVLFHLVAQAAGQTKVKGN